MSHSETYDIVKTLCELPAPVGHEDAVQDWLVDRLGGFAEVRRTRVDNVLAKVGGAGPRLIVTGHADEICYVVKSVSDDGFLHIWPYYGDTRGHPPRWMIPRVIWNPPVRCLRGSRITGKAMGDRAALAIATLAGEARAGRDDLAYEVSLGSTIQEDKRDYPCVLGGGPILVYSDNTAHYSRRLTDRLGELAAGLGMPVQRAVFQNYGSDAAALLKRGVEIALIIYPTRYTRSPIETVDLNDLHACVHLIVAFATTSSFEQRKG